MVRYAAQRTGLLVSLEAAATIAAYHHLLASHALEPEQETVLFATGSGLPEVGKPV